MTVTEPATTSALAEYVLAAAESARAAISGADAWTVDAGAADAVLPAAGSRAVQSQVGAATLLLVADAELARHLQVGPPPADDLIEGSLPALEAAVLALAPLLESTTLGPLSETDPAAGLPADGREVVVARLSADGVHRASLVLLVPVAAPVAEAPQTPGSEQPRPTRLSSVPSGLELLHDVEMGVTAELGRTRMLVREVLELVPGSVIELDRAAGSPVDVLVNGTLIARGEVVVIDEEFGIRITEVVGYDEERSL
jgi:flagellar motor switch protein FliN/FliY